MHMDTPKDCMTSRERLLTTLNHREPDRVPVMFWGTIAPMQHRWNDHVRRAVIDAIRAAARGGCFILASADAIMQEGAHDNMMTMIDTCHEFGPYPIEG